MKTVLRRLLDDAGTVALAALLLTASIGISLVITISGSHPPAAMIRHFQAETILIYQILVALPTAWILFRRTIPMGEPISLLLAPTVLHYLFGGSPIYYGLLALVAITTISRIKHFVRQDTGSTESPPGNAP